MTQQSTARLEDALTEWYGERCPDTEPGCPTCDAWAELDALKASMAWQPIETAPRDGTIIILTTGDATGTGRWRCIGSRDTLNDLNGIAQFKHEYGWHSVSDKRLNNQKITHWMPLPSAPEAPL